MELTVEEKTATAVGDFGARAAELSGQLEGRKTWKSPRRLVFEPTRHNLRVFRELFPGPAPVHPYRTALETSPPTTGHSPATLLDAHPWRMEPLDFQLENFGRFKDLRIWAIFSEQGTGKTKTAIDIISYRFAVTQTLSAVLVLSMPKGVHAQWIEKQIPKHIWPGIDLQAAFWDGKKAPPWFSEPVRSSQLEIFSGNIDMLVHERSFEVLVKFVRRHINRILILVDESDGIKNFSSQRNKNLRKLAAMATTDHEKIQRAIMTGTPIAKDLTDEWSQFYFLDPNIVGHKYKTSFMAQYCRMGGFEGRSVIGHRNLDQFKALTAPYIFRATKDELNLPEKVMDEVEFDMTDEQKRLIKNIKEGFIAQVDSGEKVNAGNAAVAMMRMQQISNGFFTDEDGKVVYLKDNPRLKALQRLREETESSKKAIIWCRFNADIEMLLEQIPGSVDYYGGTNDKNRLLNLERFEHDEQCNELVASPAALGRGVDGLQNYCHLAIYYSNSFNSIERWQSEDRIHRMGMNDTASYFDLIARGSPDRSIIRNLRNKKSISDLALSDLIREIREAA